MTNERARKLEESWAMDARWNGVERPYSAEEVIRLRGSIDIEHTLARRGAEKFWNLLQTEDYIHALGALTGNQAVQQVKAGLKAIYLSGWQVAADANLSGHMYPDQSLYPANSVPAVVKRINQALQRADQIQHMEGEGDIDWFAPIIADAEAGFGGQLNVFELMKGMIEAGAAAVHFEDQLSSEKKCGHLGGKVLLPTQTAVKNLISARLAADVSGVPTIIIARTDADAADLITSDVDPEDQAFITGERTAEGFSGQQPGSIRRLPADLLMRLMPTLFGAKRQSRTLIRLRSLRMPFMRSFLGSFLPTTAPHPLTGKRNWTKKQLRNSKEKSRKWAINSSSLLLPDSMPSTTACSSSPENTAITEWQPIRSFSRQSLQANNTATQRQDISVKSEQATLMKCHRLSQEAHPPQLHLKVQQKKSSLQHSPKKAAASIGVRQFFYAFVPSLLKW